MQVSERTFESVLMDDPEGQWELHGGRPRRKPEMGQEHNWLMFYVGHLLQLQFDIREFRIRVNAGHVARPPATYFIPDIVLIPVALERPWRGRPGTFETYADPLPLVVEVWSLSTGGYDVDAKLPEYQKRGDAEIWRFHPYERTLTSWRRQPDGGYTETLFTGGTIALHAFPNVTIDLDALFATLDM